MNCPVCGSEVCDWYEQFTDSDPIEHIEQMAEEYRMAQAPKESEWMQPLRRKT